MNIRIDFFSDGRLTEEDLQGLSSEMLAEFAVVEDLNLVVKCKNGLEYIPDSFEDLHVTFIDRSGYLAGSILLTNVSITGTFGNEGDAVQSKSTAEDFEIDLITDLSFHVVVPRLSEEDARAMSAENFQEYKESVFNFTLGGEESEPLLFRELETPFIIHSVKVSEVSSEVASTDADGEVEVDAYWEEKTLALTTLGFSRTLLTL